MALKAFRRGPAGAPPDVTVRSCGPLVNAQDRPAEGAGGRLHLDLIADGLAQEGMAHRRLVADAVLLGVRLRGAHAGVSLPLALMVLDGDGGAQGDPLVVVRLLDDDGVLDNRLQGEDVPLPASL